MVESNRQVQISDPFERFDEAINDPRLYPIQYERPESRQLEPLPHDHVPLFLSDYDQQYEEEPYDDPPQYTFGSKQPKSYTGRIVSGAIAACAAAAPKAKTPALYHYRPALGIAAFLWSSDHARIHHRPAESLDPLSRHGLVVSARHDCCAL